MATSDYSWQMSDWENALDGVDDGFREDGKELDEVKLTTRLTKTKEEIERLTIEEGLSDVEKCLLLLREGASIQKHSALSTFKELSDPSARSKVLKLLSETLLKESTEIQVAAGKVILDILTSLKKTSVSPESVDALLPVMKKFVDSRDQDVLTVWADVMIAAIQVMTMSVLESEVLPEAILNGGLAQPAPFRLWSCRVMGALAKRMDRDKIEQTFFRKAMALCQDTDYEVRACMCQQLNAIAWSVGPVVTKRDILDEYLELFNDEEDIVREAALTEFVRLLTPPTSLESGSQDLGYLEKAFSQFSLRNRKLDFESNGNMLSDDFGNGLSLIDAETKINMVIPTWKKLCSEKSTRLLPILCHEFGLFLFCTMDVMKEDDFEWFLNWFQKASTMREQELKVNCAYNLPCIAKCIATVPNVNPSFTTTATTTTTQNNPNTGSMLNAQNRRPGRHNDNQPIPNPLSKSRFFPLLFSIMDELSKDEFPEVRRRVAGGLHEVAHMLASDAYRHLREIWVRLLSDDNLDVFHAIVKTMDIMFHLFTKDEMWTKYDMEFNDLLFLTMKRERAWAHDMRSKWRIQLDLLTQYRNFAEYFDPEHIHAHVVPFLIQLMMDNSACVLTSEVRQLVTSTLCTYARRLPKMEYRDFIWMTMKEEFTNFSTTPYRHRLVFLDLCRAVLNTFSSKFFKDNFFHHYLDTSRDPVPNVRMKMCELLPQVRKSLKLPVDSGLLQKLNDALGILLTQERDRDVSRCASEMVDRMTNNQSKDVRIVKNSYGSLSSMSSNQHMTTIGSSGLRAATAGISFDLVDKEREEEEARMIAEELAAEETKMKQEGEYHKRSNEKLLGKGHGAKDKFSNNTNATNNKKGFVRRASQPVNGFGTQTPMFQTSTSGSFGTQPNFHTMSTTNGFMANRTGLMTPSAQKQRGRSAGGPGYNGLPLMKPSLSPIATTTSSPLKSTITTSVTSGISPLASKLWTADHPTTSVVTSNNPLNRVSKNSSPYSSSSPISSMTTVSATPSNLTSLNIPSISTQRAKTPRVVPTAQTLLSTGGGGGGGTATNYKLSPGSSPSNSSKVLPSINSSSETPLKHATTATNNTTSSSISSFKRLK